MRSGSERIIVALDTPEVAQAVAWVEQLRGAVGAYKVGLEFLHAAGPEGVRGVENHLTVGERTVGDWVDDVMISSKVKAKLIADTEIKAADIDVSSSQGVVTLIGRVGSQAIKSDADRIARGTKGVNDVNNELLVNFYYEVAEATVDPVTNNLSIRFRIQQNTGSLP